ncbi:hypothetical protein [Pseudonocardia acidicola]|uniref:MinD-like ATPase involved in chromosome partitioning or flagellar assembly n=1 Tax=Pseudonocardia acidicola TaxID=2724939 RepID=A0ABX1SH39_9PSEU|nr:hypothetical protein [Pseudonocardia acidicola]NMI00897.1 hypothetical protein [Pseudonocardia acidicola]
MNGLRAPVVAGVAGGVGTTTVAVALRAHDAGRVVDTRVDVLVCRCTGNSLHRAARLADRLAGHGPRPVLAVTADGAVPTRGPLHARLRMIEPQFAAVVVLPHVGRWRELADPLAEAAGLLAQAAGDLPRPLRNYAAALRRLATSVAATGRLSHGAPAPRRTVPPRADRRSSPSPIRPVRGIRIVPPENRPPGADTRRSVRLTGPALIGGPHPLGALNGARP